MYLVESYCTIWVDLVLLIFEGGIYYGMDN